MRRGVLVGSLRSGSRMGIGGPARNVGSLEVIALRLTPQ